MKSPKKKTLSVMVAFALCLSAFAMITQAADLLDSYSSVNGTWSYNDGKLTGGTADNNMQVALSKETIKKGEHVTVSVDAKLNAAWTECGFGLYFNTLAPGASDDPYNGMGVLTWTGSFGGQFKTWSWKLDKIASIWDGNPADVWWVADNAISYNDTSTVFNITAEWLADNTIVCTLTNKTTGEKCVINNGPLPLQNNTDTLYVGLNALNCNVTFSNLRVTHHAATADDSSPDTGDMFFALLSLAAVSVTAGIMINRNKRMKVRK